MPLPVLKTEVSKAIDRALEKTGVLPAKQEIIQYLDEAGADNEAIAHRLAHLIINSSDSVSLKAIRQALELKDAVTPNQGAQINIQIISEQGNSLDSVFAPKREIIDVRPEDY